MGFCVPSTSPTSNRHSRLQSPLCSQAPHCPWACLCARMRYFFSGSEGKGLATKQWPAARAGHFLCSSWTHLAYFQTPPYFCQLSPSPNLAFAVRFEELSSIFSTHLYLYLEPWVKISSDARHPFPPPPTRRSYLKISTQPSQIIFLRYLRIQNGSNPDACSY